MDVCWTEELTLSYPSERPYTGTRGVCEDDPNVLSVRALVTPYLLCTTKL